MMKFERDKQNKCGARTRAGGHCKAPGRTNGRCRMHGGLSTGPKTPEGRKRSLEALARGRAKRLKV